MSVPGELHALVERFDRDRDSYRSGTYNEAQARVDFINPLLGLLGWDVENREGRPEAYRDVVYEDRVKVGGGTKAPDYGFYAGGLRRFFLEAKKPSVDIAGDLAPAVQLRRYAWSARLPLSVLTDFEEFAIYDCRSEPEKDDSPTTARLELFTYDRYAEEAVWERISSVFSRDAVLDGSLERYAEENRKRRGKETVDAAFLREIEGWRSDLARDIAARNDLNTRELNYAVQMTIDRIIFLRMAEDRGIEDYGRLMALLNGGDTYRRLCEVFRDANDRYNSGLFHFRDERGRDEEPDRLTPAIEIDDTVLKGIIRGLYYPESPYEFSVLPVDVLGQVYEQFLGRVIQLEDGHTATVEEKPEVRKAGGVYYTPTYIVDYIVEKTVGKLLEGKRPGPRGGVSRIKIVDPACGSGSFLIGAYTYLLDWHRDRYVEDGPEKWKDRLYEGPGGQHHLTIDEKRRILLNNIYGVDIDPQAVEVTKLSLLLKVLEGESEASLATQLRMFQERALPDLDENIKCGNSLIGPDFYDNEQMMLLDEEEHYRINVFDWRESFPQIFQGDDSGFDAVIGNPPYIRMEAFTVLKPYLRSHFRVHAERADLYAYFLEKGLNLLRSGGHLGEIVSNKFIRAKYGKRLRTLLSQKATIDTIADFAGANVFQGATVRTVVLIASRGPNQDGDRRASYVPVPSKEQLLNIASSSTNVAAYSEANSYMLATSALTPDEWQLLPESYVSILLNIRQGADSLTQWLHGSALFGLKTGLNDAFVIDENTRNELIETDTASAEVIKPVLFGRDVRRYFVAFHDRYVIYLHPSRNLEDYPAIKMHLAKYRDALEKRAASQEWFELQQPATSLIEHNREVKIVYPIIANECRFALDEKGYFINDKLFTLPSNDPSLLGILNSRLANFYFGCVCAALEGSGDRYLEFRAQYVDEFPVANGFSDWDQRSKLASLVERMLELHERLAGAKIERERTVIGHQISATDRQIDRLVYELYDLADEEIKIVEEATGR